MTDQSATSVVTSAPGAPSPSGRGSKLDALTTRAPAIMAVRTAAAAGLTATLGLAAACWVVSVWQMTGMNMGTATRLGSFAFFTALWVAMMAAMMLPGAAPAVARAAHTGGVRAVPLFIGSYLPPSLSPSRSSWLPRPPSMCRSHSRSSHSGF